MRDMRVVTPGQVRKMSAFISVRLTTPPGMMSFFSVSTFTYFLTFRISAAVP